MQTAKLFSFPLCLLSTPSTSLTQLTAQCLFQWLLRLLSFWCAQFQAAKRRKWLNWSGRCELLWQPQGHIVSARVGARKSIIDARVVRWRDCRLSQLISAARNRRHPVRNQRCQREKEAAHRHEVYTTQYTKVYETHNITIYICTVNVVCSYFISFFPFFVHIVLWPVINGTRTDFC